MLSGEFVDFDAIKNALPPILTGWTEKKLIRLGHVGTLLFVREGDRTSKPVWYQQDVIAFFKKRLRNAPHLAEEFARNLTAPTKAKRKAVKS